MTIEEAKARLDFKIRRRLEAGVATQIWDVMEMSHRLYSAACEELIAQERHQAEVYRQRMAELEGEVRTWHDRYGIVERELSLQIAALESELAGLRRGDDGEAVTEATDAYERLDSWARLVCEYLETRPDDEINGAPLLLSIYRERCRALGVTLNEGAK